MCVWCAKKSEGLDAMEAYELQVVAMVMQQHQGGKGRHALVCAPTSGMLSHIRACFLRGCRCCGVQARRGDGPGGLDTDMRTSSNIDAHKGTGSYMHTCRH